MRILILGGNGMLGRALAREFADEEVIAWDKSQLDITDERAVAEHLPMLEPDVVVNAAGYTNVEKAEDEPEEADAVNGHAVGNLAVAAADANIPLLHVSTDYVFDGKQEGGYAEDDEPRNPLCAYGRSKLLGETLLKDTGKDFWLVRTAWLFGPQGRHFVDAILRSAAVKPLVRVVADQHGNPTSAQDLARAIRELIADRPPFGIYHLVNSGTATWADLAEATLALTGNGARVERIPSSAYPVKATRPTWSVLRNTKRPPLRPWKEALADYLKVRQEMHA